MSGIDYVKRRKKWRVRIRVGIKDIFIGHYNLLEEAIKARDTAKEKYKKKEQT